MDKKFKTLGELLKYKRTVVYGCTVEEMSKKMEISKPTYISLEKDRGRNAPTVTTIRKIAITLNEPYEYIANLVWKNQ